MILLTLFLLQFMPQDAIAVESYLAHSREFVEAHNGDFGRIYREFVEVEREYFLALETDSAVLDIRKEQGLERSRAKGRMVRIAKQVREGLKNLMKKWERVEKEAGRLP